MVMENRLLGEIQNWFEDFAVSLTDLQKPTYVFVRDFYCRALVEFEVDVENVRRAVGLASDTEIDIAGDVNLVAAINRVFRSLDFGLFDLLNPTENHRRTISLMCNTMEFMSLADDLTTRLDLDSYRDWRKNIQTQEQQVDDYKNKISEVAMEKDRCEQENIQLEQMILAAKKKKEEKKNQRTAVVAEAKAALKHLQNKKTEMKEVADSIEKTKTKVLELREELHCANSLESREEERQKSEKEKADLHTKYKERSEQKKQLTLVVDSIKKHSSLVLEVGQLVDDAQKEQEALLAVQKEIAELELVTSAEIKKAAGLTSEQTALKQKEIKMKQDFDASKAEREVEMLELSKKSSALLAAIASAENELSSEQKLLESVKNKQRENLEQLKRYFVLLKTLVHKGDKPGS